MSIYTQRVLLTLHHILVLAPVYTTPYSTYTHIQHKRSYMNMCLTIGREFGRSVRIRCSVRLGATHETFYSPLYILSYILPNVTCNNSRSSTLQHIPSFLSHCIDRSRKHRSIDIHMYYNILSIIISFSFSFIIADCIIPSYILGYPIGISSLSPPTHARFRIQCSLVHFINNYTHYQNSK